MARQELDNQFGHHAHFGCIHVKAHFSLLLSARSNKYGVFSLHVTPTFSSKDYHNKDTWKFLLFCPRQVLRLTHRLCELSYFVFLARIFDLIFLLKPNRGGMSLNKYWGIIRSICNTNIAPIYRVIKQSGQAILYKLSPKNLGYNS